MSGSTWINSGETETESKMLMYENPKPTAADREWGNDKSWRTSLVLVTINVQRVGHAHDAVVQLRVPVVAQLLLPLKVVDAANLPANRNRKLEKVALDGSVECCAPPPRWCDLEL